MFMSETAAHIISLPLSERSGNTLIPRITHKYRHFKKDVDGVKISGSYEILDAVHLVGAEDEVFDKCLRKGV